MKRYISLWLCLAMLTTQISLESRFGAAMFTFGKLLRFVFFLLFIILLGVKTNVIGNYSLWQMVLFYLSFNFIDTTAQLFLREVYRFRNYVVNGFFDYILIKPMSPLFRCLFGGADILDIFLLFISISALVITITHISGITIQGIVFYILLLANGLLIALACHIIVLGIGIVTTEVDNTLWLYRDLTQMGRFPIDIYKEPIRSFLTFVVPVGIMITFPAKALMGLLTVSAVCMSLILGVLFFTVSLYVWTYALRRYTSASS